MANPFRELTADQVAAISKRNRASRIHKFTDQGIQKSCGAELPRLIPNRQALRKKLPPPTEHAEQCALIQWWDYVASQQYKLHSYLLFAIPNAGAGAQSGQAGKLKAEGVRPGIPDLFLAHPTRAHAGLFIEMKRIGQGPKPNQAAVHAGLRSKGYAVEVCQGFERAKAAIEAYLSEN